MTQETSRLVGHAVDCAGDHAWSDLCTFDNPDFPRQIPRRRRPHNLIPIRFAEDYPSYVRNAPLVMWDSATSTLESFKRATRKAKARGMRLLSFHFVGDNFVANFGV